MRSIDLNFEKKKEILIIFFFLFFLLLSDSQIGTENCLDAIRFGIKMYHLSTSSIESAEIREETETSHGRENRAARRPPSNEVSKLVIFEYFLLISLYYFKLILLFFSSSIEEKL